MPEYNPQRSQSRPKVNEGPAPVDALLGSADNEKTSGNGDPRPIGGDRLVVDLDNPAPPPEPTKPGPIIAAVAATVTAAIFITLLLRRRRRTSKSASSAAVTD